MKRPLILWILAIVVTLSSVVYQRLTGPTHAMRGKAVLDGEVIHYKLLRSQETTGDAVMKIEVPSRQTTGALRWRRLRSNDEWRPDPLQRRGDTLIATIPRQPAAGKVIYTVSLTDGQGVEHLLSPEPVVIRFKGAVPDTILFPHVVLMFVAMLLATRTGLEAIAKNRNAYRFTAWTAVLFLVGGIILGPIVQKYAFGEFWTGWPFGHDLTDNKTAVAMFSWLIPLWRGRDLKKSRVWIIVAMAVTLLVYLIPHSLLGSELDYTQAGG
ncbi:MAG: hypothetical protein OEW00_14920 [candidate division Zixibacteria bacterium]|nr:hypothetical protein [candidate division Zixibacteria bacterium]